MHHLLNTVLDFIAAHTYMSYGVIFLISLSESLAIVGLVVPGTVIMFSIGAVIASGSLSLLPVLVFAALGAIVGDGVSYWLGHHYRDRLRSVWPFSRYPAILASGETFFHKHSRKSIMFGRFVGPVRPVIPVVAGMLGMPPLSFTIVNVLSAVAWANVYILPGVLLGASISVAKAVSTRLAVLVLIVLVSAWVFFRLARMTERFIENKGPGIQGRLVKWASEGRMNPAKKLINFIFLRQKGEEFLFIFLILLLTGAAWGFLGVLQDVIAHDPLIIADKGIYHFFRSIRTVWGDNFFVALTELGDAFVNVSVFSAVFILLLVKRCRRAALYWSLAVLCGLASVQLLKYSVHLPRPVSIYHGASAYGFPSGHTATSVIIYGFPGILFVRYTKSMHRWLLLSAVLTVTFMIGLSRLYLGAHWFSDVIGGFFVGTFWVTLFGITYLKKKTVMNPGRAFVLTFSLALLVSGVWHISIKHGRDLSFYRVRSGVQTITAQAWHKSGWKRLPAWRVDMEGEHEQPFTVQYTGDISALKERLMKNGWHRPPSIGMKSVIGFFSPSVTADQLPALPRMHDGKTEKLLLVRSAGDKRWELRIWRSYFDIDGGKHIYAGTVEEQKLTHSYWIFAVFSRAGNYENSLKKLTGLKGGGFSTVNVFRHVPAAVRSEDSEPFSWNGETLLILENNR